jgi:hypothetical protein
MLAGDIERIAGSEAFRGNSEPWASFPRLSAARLSPSFSVPNWPNGPRQYATAM